VGDTRKRGQKRARAPAGFAAACAEVCPGFLPLRRIAARKSELLAGTVDGAPAIAKRLARPDEVWAWYLRREIAIYRAFAAAPPALRVPRLLAADEERGVLVLERVPGAPLATHRRPRVPPSAADAAALVELRRRIAAWPGPLPPDPPRSPRASRQIAARLLEDPTAPRAWFHAGVARCAESGLLPADVARRIDAALAAHPAVALSHGDLLLRNVIRDGDQLALVDWECAGLHLEDWDLALVWIQLEPPARVPIEAAVRAGGPTRWHAFLGLAAFALARELSFLRAFRRAAPDGAAATRLRAELAATSAAFAA
jgi:aminoglycoside phosphotransferase (APT) family kinase protein